MLLLTLHIFTLQVNINKQKKDAFQILKPELEVDPQKNPHFDARMGIDKTKLLRPKRMSFQFVEEGKWSKDAEVIKLKVIHFLCSYLCNPALHFYRGLIMFTSYFTVSVWGSKSQGTKGKASTAGKGKGRANYEPKFDRSR